MNALRASQLAEQRYLCRRVALAAVLLFPVTTAAQQPTSEDPGVPSLFGHAFVIPILVRTPFARTNVSSTVGVGQALDIEFGPVELPNGDTLAVLNGSLTFAVLRFEYEHALRDWLSVWGRLEVAARVGTDVGALLSAGVTLATGFELGWLAQVRETERSLLSASAFVRSSDQTLVDLTRWVDELTNGNITNLVRKTPSTRGGVGLGYAWALNNLIGFMFGGEATYGQALTRQADRFFFSGTAAISLNLSPRTNVPLGVAATFRVDSHPSVHGDQDEGWEAVGLRLSYTGRDDFRLSITSEGLRVPHRDNLDLTVGLITLEIQYFF
jgi:hypothetical protein